MKFKIGFTIEGETLFRMLAQFLPIENLSVEEIAPPPLAPQAKLARQFIKHLDTLPSRKKRRPTRPVSLTTGINKIIVDELSHGMARSANDIKPAVLKAGYSANSIASRLQALLEHGVVEHIGSNAWRIADAYSHLIKK